MRFLRSSEVVILNLVNISAFVGLAVMILLAPVPTWVASLMSGVQKEKMKAVSCRNSLTIPTRSCKALQTDGRVQGVTEGRPYQLAELTRILMQIQS